MMFVQKFTQSLRKNPFFLWVVLVSILPAFLLAFLAYNQSKHHIKTESYEKLSSIAGKKITEISRTINLYNKNITLFSRTTEVINFINEPSDDNKQVAMKYINQIMRLYTFYNILILNKDGKIILNYDKSDLMSIGNTRQLNKTVDNAVMMSQSIISKFYTNVKTGDSYAYVVSPVFYNNTYIGSVAYVISQKSLGNILLDTEGLGEAGKIFVFTKDRGTLKLVFSNTRMSEIEIMHRLHQHSEIKNNFLNTFIGEETESTTMGFSDEKILGIWRYVPSLNWSIMIAVKQDDALLHLYEFQQQMLLLLILSFIFSLIISYLISKRFQDLNQKVVDALDIASKARDEAMEANEKIKQSIDYAKLIQTSLLPKQSLIDFHASDNYVLWQPKDIIGGDIYVFEEIPDGYIIAAIDCTGHGIPGAIMSMLSVTLIKRIINEKCIYDPASILQNLSADIKKALHQEGRESKSNDGLDASVCQVNLKKEMLTFAGANLHLLYQSQDEIIKIKGDNHSIGYIHSDPDFPFTNHKIHLKKTDSFYLYTDGVVDQLGGEKGFSFSEKRFLNLIRDIFKEPASQQKKIILKAYNEYKGNLEQVDDLTVLGIKTNSD